MYIPATLQHSVIYILLFTYITLLHFFMSLWLKTEFKEIWELFDFIWKLQSEFQIFNDTLKVLKLTPMIGLIGDTCPTKYYHTDRVVSSSFTLSHFFYILTHTHLAVSLTKTGSEKREWLLRRNMSVCEYDFCMNEFVHVCLNHSGLCYDSSCLFSSVTISDTYHHL